MNVPTLPASPEDEPPPLSVAQHKARTSLIAEVAEASDWVLLPALQGTRALLFSVGIKTGPLGAVQACVLWSRPNAFHDGPDMFDSRSHFTDAPRGIAFALTTAAAMREAAGARP